MRAEKEECGPSGRCFDPRARDPGPVGGDLEVLVTQDRAVTAVLVQNGACLPGRTPHVQHQDIRIDGPIGAPPVHSDVRFGSEPPGSRRLEALPCLAPGEDQRLHQVGHVAGLLALGHPGTESGVRPRMRVGAGHEYGGWGDPHPLRDPAPDGSGLVGGHETEVRDHEDHARHSIFRGRESQGPSVQRVVDPGSDPLSGAIAHQLDPGIGGDLDPGGSSEKAHDLSRGPRTNVRRLPLSRL